jgi:hypothetical protein
MQIKYLETGNISTNLMGCSERSGKVGGELMVADSGDVWRKGTEKFQSLGLPLFDSFVLDDHLE